MTKSFEIWCEGYVVTGGRSDAQYMGTGYGDTFQEACEEFFNHRSDLKSNYDSGRNAYWGCRLFDNEQDARKSFG